MSRLTELVATTHNEFEFNQQLNAVRNLCNEDPCDDDANINDHNLRMKMNNSVGKLMNDFEVKFINGSGVELTVYLISNHFTHWERGRRWVDEITFSPLSLDFSAKDG